MCIIGKEEEEEVDFVAMGIFINRHWIS